MTDVETNELMGGSDESNEILLVNWIAYNVVAFIIVSIGIIGNLLNLIVLTRPNLKGVMYVYLLGLAVSNLAVLISAIPALMAIGNNGGEESSSYLIMFYQAHLELPLINTFMASSVYIIICMTVNRYISIYKPTQFQRIHTFKNARIAITFSFLGGFFLHIPLCFEKKVTELCSGDPSPLASYIHEGKQYECMWTVISNSSVKDHGLYRVYIYISEALLRFGPIITLTILNILIITRFQRIARKRQDLRGLNQHRDSTQAPPTPNHVTLNPTPGGGGGVTINEPSSSSSSGTNNALTPIHRQKNGSLMVPKSPINAAAHNGNGSSRNFVVSPRTPHRTSTRRRGLHNPEERMLVVVLIAIVILFVCCTTPAGFLTIFMDTLADTKDINLGLAIFRAIANNLELLNFALNFYIYCLCSADIRRAFVSTFNGAIKTLRSHGKNKNNNIEMTVATHQENGNGIGDHV